MRCLLLRMRLMDRYRIPWSALAGRSCSELRLLEAELGAAEGGDQGEGDSTPGGRGSGESLNPNIQALYGGPDEVPAAPVDQLPDYSRDAVTTPIVPNAPRDWSPPDANRTPTSPIQRTGSNPRLPGGGGR